MSHGFVGLLAGLGVWLIVACVERDGVKAKLLLGALAPMVATYGLVQTAFTTRQAEILATVLGLVGLAFVCLWLAVCDRIERVQPR